MPSLNSLYKCDISLCFNNRPFVFFKFDSVKNHVHLSKFRNILEDSTSYFSHVVEKYSDPFIATPEIIKIF